MFQTSGAGGFGSDRQWSTCAGTLKRSRRPVCAGTVGIANGRKANDIAGLGEGHSMLTEQELVAWAIRNRLSDFAQSAIARTRSFGPSRRVGGGYANVT